MKPNILFLVIDGLRADKCFSKTKTSVTPNIDKLIKNGVYFNQTISSGSGSTPSVSSIFSSLYPFECVVQDRNLFKMNPKILTHVEKLQSDGYKTYAIIQEPLAHIGFKKIFGNHLVIYNHAEERLWSGLGEKILENFEFIKKQEPWFCYMQFYDLNLLIYPNDERLEKGPKEIEDSKYGKNQYERIISAQDKWIGEIINQVDFEKTLIILTSDHGLESGAYNDELQKFDNEQRIKRAVPPGPFLKMGLKAKSVIPFRKKFAKKYKEYASSIKEKKQIPELENLKKMEAKPYEKRLMEFSVWPRSNIYDDRVHVPLIFSGYKIPKDKIVNELSKSIDIFPTIFDICELQYTFENRRGRSLLPLIKEMNLNEIPVFIESAVNVVGSPNDNAIGLRTKEFKYFRDRENPSKNVHLYNLIDDPLEVKNIFDKNQNLIKKFESELAKISKEFLMEGSEDEIGLEEAQKIEEQLRKAGYIN